MTKKQKRNLKRILISLGLFLIVFITDLVLSYGFKFEKGIGSLIPGQFGWFLPLGLYFAIYLYIGHDVLKKAFLNIIHGQMLDENFLMCVATIGAFGLGIYRGITGAKPEGLDEGCAVLLFYQVGEWFQGYAVGKSRKSITGLMDIRPDFANVIRDGEISTVDPSEVKLEEIILVKPGEKIPLDGVIIEGTSSLDTKALTGESLPQEVTVGNNVISGTVNITGTIKVKVLKEFYDSTVSKILDLVENASSQKSRSENFISKFAKVYTPIVVFGALAVFIIPGWITGNWLEWLERALNFLVVSCPCALVISVPLSFFAGIGGASRKGILVKGSSYLERFNKVNVFVFDKTGTLTKGNFAIVDVAPASKRDEIIKYAAIAEQNSNHPIAVSIKNAYKEKISDEYTITDISGKGIMATGKKTILCGNEKLMNEYNISFTENNGIGTVVYVAVDNEFFGSIVIADELKEDAVDTIKYLNSIGSRTIMLTGDNERIASSVANKLGLTEYKSSLLPQNKVEEVDKLLNSKKENELLCFVGDGINDAPVLMKSDIGISMGGVGSDAAIEASDIVLMHDDLKSIGVTKKIAKKTMGIVYQNIIFALFVKVAILVLSAVGLANMWLAIFADVGVSVICILNAMRTNSKKY